MKVKKWAIIYIKKDWVIMRIVYILFSALILLDIQGKAAECFVKESNRVLFRTEKGTLVLSPFSENTVRVNFCNTEIKSFPELVFVSKTSLPGFRVNEYSDYVPHSKAINISDCGLSLFEDNPKEFSKIVLIFLNDK